MYICMYHVLFMRIYLYIVKQWVRHCISSPGSAVYACLFVCVVCLLTYTYIYIHICYIYVGVCVYIHITIHINAYIMY